MILDGFFFRHNADEKPIGRLKGIVVILKDGSKRLITPEEQLPLGWLDRIESVEFEIEKENTHESINGC